MTTVTGAEPASAEPDRRAPAPADTHDSPVTRGPVTAAGLGADLGVELGVRCGAGLGAAGLGSGARAATADGRADGGATRGGALARRAAKGVLGGGTWVAAGELAPAV